MTRHSLEAIECSKSSAVASPWASPRARPVRGNRRHPDFVEQRQTFLDVAVQDAQPRCRHSSDGARRSVAARDRALGPLPSAVEVPGQHPLVPRTAASHA